MPRGWLLNTHLVIVGIRLTTVGVVAFSTLYQPKRKGRSCAEESATLLSSDGYSAYGTVDRNAGNSSTQFNTGSNPGSTKTIDSATRAPKFRNEQLHTWSGWWNYLTDISIFLPFLIPRDHLKVQLCIATNIACLAGYRVLNILIPRQLGVVTDRVLARETPYASLGTWALLQLIRGDAVLGLTQALSKIPIRQFSYSQITSAALGRVLDLSMDFHIENDSAEIMKAIDQGGTLNSLLEVAILDIVPTVIDLLLACGVFYLKFNIYASLLVVLISTAYVSTEVFTSNWTLVARRETIQAQRKEARIMHQAVQNWQAATLFNQVDHEERRFAEAIDLRHKASASWGQRWAFGRALLGLVKPASFVAFSVLIIHEISVGRASPGDFFFFVQYWSSLIAPLARLSAKYRKLVSDLVDAERLLSLFMAKPSVAENENAVHLAPRSAQIVFSHVNFSYQPGRSTLQDVSVVVEPGTTVALVGMSGSGKTTILQLLLRLYDVTAGRIEIDGQDIRNVTLKSLRKAIGVVPQHPVLFNASINENLRYACPLASDDQIRQACQNAAIHEKIMTFVDGYNTVVGEQGIKLSGGELQRLAIARVFLKNSPILVLDEATSAVDSTTESGIQEALDRLRAERTAIIIAHRLSTIMNAHRILVLHEGKVVESGSHTELLDEEAGLYRKLWATQFGSEGHESQSAALS
jgi:ABC-type transport system involved in Fe-S cluster assembly fused permease/ATPase subunit